MAGGRFRPAFNVSTPQQAATLGEDGMGWLPKFKIAQKLPLALVGSALLVSAGVGIASYLIGSSTVD